jgi:hypothetical protein
MLLQKVNKRSVIFNNILRSRDIEKLHSLKFDCSQQDQKWRITERYKESGRIGWTLLLALGISFLILIAIFALRDHA